MSEKPVLKERREFRRAVWLLGDGRGRRIGLIDVDELLWEKERLAGRQVVWEG